MKLNDEMIRICEIQAELFQDAQNEFKAGSATFIYHFMYSSLAKKLDDVHYLAMFDPVSHKAQLIEEYPSLQEENGPYIPQNIMHWLGYIYRAASFILEIPSKLLFKYMPYQEMVLLYNVYHTFGVDYCVDRLNEHFEIDSKIKDREKELVRQFYYEKFMSI